ncbi:hypothetical protein Aperf_G00000077056 [Anoplocephala perfoliata]
MEIPASAVVTITDTSPNQFLHLISIQTSSFTLYFKPINVEVLEPQQATTITLVLVANKVGHIEADLYATTNSGLAKCKVNRLTLRASDGALNDENQVLFLSPGNSFHSKHNDPPNSITLAGQQRSELRSLTFSGIEPNTLKSLVSGTNALSDASVGDSALPKCSLSNFLLRRFSLKPSVFLVPVEPHFDDLNLFTVQEFLDFGILRHSFSSRQTHLTTFNKLVVPSVLHVNSTDGKNCFGISYDPVSFSGGQPPIVIPRMASLLQGSLQFGHQRLSFFCGGLEHFVDQEIWEYQLLTTFAGLFEVRYSSIIIKQFLSNYFHVFRSSKEPICECKIDSFYLTFYTDTSSFDVPLDFYDAKLSISFPSAVYFAVNHASGAFEVGGRYNLQFYISNSNFVSLPLKRSLVDEQTYGECVGLVQVDQHAGLFCRCSEAEVSSRVCKSASVMSWAISPRFHVLSVIISQMLCINICRSTYGDYHHWQLLLRMPDWIRLVVTFRHQQKVDAGAEWIPLVELNILPACRVSAGTITITAPQSVYLSSVFPDNPISWGLRVHNVLMTDAAYLTALEPHAIDELFTLRAKLNQQPAEVKRASLKPQHTALIGPVAYDASLTWREVLNADAITILVRVCYAGFKLANFRGKHWFASNLLPFSADGGIKSTLRSVIDFLPGLRYSTKLFTLLQSAWHSLFRHIHAATIGVVLVAAESTEHCRVPGYLALNSDPGDEKIPKAENVVTGVVCPRILSGHLSVDQASSCHLNISFGSMEGLFQLQIHNRLTEPVSCRLTFINPTDKPLFIQPILLDDLIPVSMNYSEMITQMPILSRELFRAAHIPQHLTEFPRHPSQRTGRFISHFDAAKYEGEHLESLGSIMSDNHLKNFVSPASCPFYTLPPRGGEVNYSITFSPGAFHNESAGQFQPKFDSSLILLRNNLTALETLLLQAVPQTTVVIIRSGLLPTESSSTSRTIEGNDRSLTTFPTATGFAFDASASYNPSLTNAACESTPLAGSVDVIRYDLCSENGEGPYPFAVADETNLSLCKVAATFLNTSMPDGSLFSFTFHEGHLRSLCSDGAVRPRPSITVFLELLKTVSPLNLIRLFTSSQAPASPPVEPPRFISTLQLAWAVDEDGMPIFSSEFLSGLVLSRRIAFFNPGSLPVWIVRVGFRQPGFTGHTAMGQCDPHLNGFSVVLCDADGSTESSHNQHRTVDGAIREFELKPGEQRWLEVLYSPDFLHYEVIVELCLFASFRAPTTERPVWLSEQMIDFPPLTSNRGPQSRSSFSCNTSNVTDCSVFQLQPITLTAKISASLAYLCYNSLLRPDLEASFWSFLLFLLASNLAGVFVAASFDAVRMLSSHESCRQLLSPTTSSTNPSENERQASSSASTPHLLDFNLPFSGQDQQQHENSASPYLRAMGNSTVQPVSDDSTNSRRRIHRSSVSNVSLTNVIFKFAKSLARSLRNGAVKAGKTVYGPVSRGVWALGRHLAGLLMSFWGQAGESECSTHPIPRKTVKSTTEASSLIRSQTQSRKFGTDNPEINSTAVRTSRKSPDDSKLTAKQSNTKSNGELTSTSSNFTQASGDGASSTFWANQSSNGNCLKIRANGAKHNSMAAGPSELSTSSKSHSGSTLVVSGALKKHSLPVSSFSTALSSPKMRVSRPTAPRPPTPPPSVPPPPPSLIMESIKAESASMGVKKSKQFIPQRQSSPQSSSSKPAATSSQSQGSAKPSANNRNLLVKQKSSPISAYDSVSVESPAQRKKLEKKVTAALSKQQPASAVPPSAPVIPAWQPRKAWTPLVVSEIPRSAENEVTTAGVSAGVPPTTAWTTTSRLTEPGVSEPSGKNRLGDLEFPPLGTVLPKRTSRTSLGDEGTAPSVSSISSVVEETTTAVNMALASIDSSTTSVTILGLVTSRIDAAPRSLLTSSFTACQHCPICTMQQMPILKPLTPAYLSTSLRFNGQTPPPNLTIGQTSPIFFNMCPYVLPNKLSRLVADTAEFDRQFRCLPSASTTASSHHFRCSGNWHDMSPRVQLQQQQQQYSFQNRYVAPHIAMPYLQRSQFATTNAQMAHRACLYNPSLSMTTLLNPQSFPSSYPTQFSTSASNFSSNASTGYSNQDLVLPIYQNVYEPLTGIHDGAYDDNFRGHRRRRSSTGQIYTDSNVPNTGIANDQELTDLMLYSSHKSALDLSSILPKEETGNEDSFCLPEWINAFDTPSPTVVDVPTSSSSPPCELQQLTETRFKSMLIHEQRGRMRPESESNILKDMSIVDCEEYVPSNLLNNLTLDDPFSGNEHRHTDFDKTVGGQLSNSEVSSAVVDLNETTRDLPDAFDMFQKTWLPAFLPWRSRFSVEDPTRDPDFAESTPYSSLRSDIPGPIIQELSETTTATDSSEAAQQLMTDSDEKLPINDVEDV